MKLKRSFFLKNPITNIKALAILTAFALSATSVLASDPISGDGFRAPISTDNNGVHLAEGQITIQTPGVSVGIPGQGGLSFRRIYRSTAFMYDQRSSRWSHNWDGGLSRRNDRIYLRAGDRSAVFFTKKENGSYVEVSDSGARLTENNDSYTFTDSDGTRVIFDTKIGPGRLEFVTDPDDDAGPFGAFNKTPIYTFPFDVNKALITHIIRPDGEVIEYRYHGFDANVDGKGDQRHHRLQSIVNNYGYEIHIEYEATPDIPSYNFHTIKKVTAINGNVERCTFSINDVGRNICLNLSRDWQTEVYSGDYYFIDHVDGPMGRVSYTSAVERIDQVSFRTSRNGRGVEFIHDAPFQSVFLIFNEVPDPLDHTFGDLITDIRSFDMPELNMSIDYAWRTPLILSGGTPEFANLIDHSGAGFTVSKITRAGGREWVYTRNHQLGGQCSVFGLSNDFNKYSDFFDVIVTNPEGNSVEYSFERMYDTGGEGGENRCEPDNDGQILQLALKAYKDESDRATFYQYFYNNSRQFNENEIGKLRRVIDPDNNSIQYCYDNRGNRIKSIQTSKPKTLQLTGASQFASCDITTDNANYIVTEMDYPASCAAGTEKICNQPTTVTGPRNFQTTFKYDPAHGGVKSIQRPDINSIVPETRFDYASFQPPFAGGTPIYKQIASLACVSDSFEPLEEEEEEIPETPPACNRNLNPECEVPPLHPDDFDPTILSTIIESSTGNSNHQCVSGDMLVTETLYHDSGAARFLPRTVTQKSDNVSVTPLVVKTTYTDMGDVKTIDGPLNGTADTIHYQYDVARREIGVIGPDPDGQGSRKRQATRTTYAPFAMPVKRDKRDYIKCIYPAPKSRNAL